MNYLNVIERYHEYRPAIRELLASIVSGLADVRLLEDEAAQAQAMRCLAAHYPFVDILYWLDADGRQLSDNIVAPHRKGTNVRVRGQDRSQRPYYRLACSGDGVVVTDPYLSSAGGVLCITAAEKVRTNGRVLGYVMLDIDLAKTIEFLMGDVTRRRFGPVFKGVYWSILVGLFTVVATLVYAAYADFVSWFSNGGATDWHLKPFAAIVYLTLALAVFDLAKTILEEEVLMHKDIFRHSSTRRTITRFIAAILIAVSIEALLLMFKSALGDGTQILQSVAVMLSAVGLLVGLGIYVNLGARAEVALLDQKARQMRQNAES